MPHDAPPPPPVPAPERELRGAAGVLAGAASTLASLRVASGFLVAAVVICGLYFGRDILVPLALALLLAFVLHPLVARLKRWGLPRVPAVALVVSATLALLLVSGAFVAKEVRDLGAELPTYQSTIRAKLGHLRESLRGPGVLDGVMETLGTVQREVERMAPPAPRAGAQRVQIVETPASPFRQAMAWLDMAAGPLAEAGIALVFVVLVLLDRLDLRDRLLRLAGGNLHRATDALDDAGARISRYLGMQIVVNLSYGIPMALGLWLIGIPGAVLWGMLAAVMRFVPYVGPMISAVFPLTLAFAVDPGWGLLLWTLGLIVLLELVSNNIVEPWLYGSSTGLSALSLILAATFWTALWGPVGLIMSTPLTVCLLVIGRYLPQLQFLDVLLGSQPALDAGTRLYQRLLAGDEEEAIALADELIDGEVGTVPVFYDTVGLPMLRMAVGDHARVATAEHRLRVVTGLEALLDDLQESHLPPPGEPGPPVLCLGGKWEMDALAARMLAHGLSLQGVPSQASADTAIRLDLAATQVVCIVWLNPQPQAQARQLCRRLRRRWPGLRIVLALWNVPAALAADDEGWRACGADAVTTSVEEAVLQVRALREQVPPGTYLPAPVPEQEADRLQALRTSGALDDAAFRDACAHTAQRAADIFDMPQAMVSLLGETLQVVRAAHGLDVAQDQPRARSMCGHVVGSSAVLVVPDSTRDPRFAAHPELLQHGVRFYAGVPLRDTRGYTLGALCLFDTVPRSFGERDAALLQALADDLGRGLQASAALSDVPASQDKDEEPPSATVGQVVPA